MGWWRHARLAAVLVLVVATGAVPRPAAQADRAPLIIVDTSKGTLVLETFPKDAPLTVAHIVSLARAGFYDGQRVHRAVPGFLVQFGDPQTRDLAKRPLWGRGTAASSGQPIGVAEIGKRLLHMAGAVGVAHAGDPAHGDSQIYITLARRPDLDGHYAVFARVVEGDDVPARLEVGDEIRRVTVREP